MSDKSLKEKAQEILAEKTLKVVAENIKKDVTIYGVTGTLQEGKTPLVYHRDKIIKIGRLEYNEKQSDLAVRELLTNNCRYLYITNMTEGTQIVISPSYGNNEWKQLDGSTSTLHINYGVTFVLKSEKDLSTEITTQYLYREFEAIVNDDTHSYTEYEDGYRLEQSQLSQDDYLFINFNETYLKEVIQATNVRIFNNSPTYSVTITINDNRFNESTQTYTVNKRGGSGGNFIVLSTNVLKMSELVELGDNYYSSSAFAIITWNN